MRTGFVRTTYVSTVVLSQNLAKRGGAIGEAVALQAKRLGLGQPEIRQWRAGGHIKVTAPGA